MSGVLTRLEAIELTVPLRQPLRLGAMPIVERHYVWVCAYDNEGNTGTSYALTRNAPVAATIARLIAPWWEGQPLENHQAFYSAAARANVFLGTNGVFMRALSVADCALFDLLAKRAGQPLYQYLGGTHRAVPVTLAGFYPTTEETDDSIRVLMETMARYPAAGIKVTSSSDYERDTRRMAVARAAMPDGPPFIVDLYCQASGAESLIPMARRWADLNMLWVEDPFQFDDFENLAVLARALDYPVGVGDEQSGLRHFQHLIELGKIGVVRLDATTCGGIRTFMEIAAMAARHGISVSTHIYHHLHSQLAAAVPNVQWIEYMLTESNAEGTHLILRSDPDWSADGMRPTQGPGIGYDWDVDALTRFRTS